MRRYLVSSDWPDFPQVLRPASEQYPPRVKAPDAARTNVAEAAQVLTEAMAAHLPSTGAVLVTSMSRWTRDAEAFSALMAHMPYSRMAYIGGGARTTLADGVSNASDDPAVVSIEPHQEMAYADASPARIVFGCQMAPPRGVGGQTPVADMRSFTRRLPKGVLDRHVEHGVRYTRSLPCAAHASAHGSPYSWEGTFNTRDPAEVEGALRERGYAFEWREADGVVAADAGGGGGGGGDGRTLYYHYVRPAFKADPCGDGSRLWWNQATTLHHTFYVDYPGDTDWHALTRGDPSRFPSDTTYGDGTPCDADTLGALRAGLWASSVAVQWREGDVLVLDNVLTGHGRVGYKATAPRKLFVTLLE